MVNWSEEIAELCAQEDLLLGDPADDQGCVPSYKAIPRH